LWSPNSEGSDVVDVWVAFIFFYYKSSLCFSCSHLCSFRKIGGSKPARTRSFHFNDFLPSSIFSLQFHLNITFYDIWNISVE
jgi:hypothetical protein